MARIVSFHQSETDNQKLKAIGYHVGKLVPESEVSEVTNKIFFHTNLNVMLQHNGTEDTIIWVDEGRFRQK